ncbi:hypothetical protein L6452_00731 [Arctium lappa]|uniref:Uncharacterized protein n=1 Tax=Arctium lappa TaxID=4217 RepID=A0ACB9FEN7_ARCLA|nr:hypothetical protein L6452_00731 [Arctium lappa]
MHTVKRVFVCESVREEEFYMILLFIPFLLLFYCNTHGVTGLIKYLQGLERGLHEEMRQFSTVLSFNQFPDRGFAVISFRS